eukprot:8778722-Pyramimonas_sp.AAC.1
MLEKHWPNSASALPSRRGGPGAGLPRSERQMLLIFPAKGGHAPDLSSAPSRYPDACRPLAMSDAD